MKTGETYLDIVWKQFKKNRGAYWSLWLLLPLFLLAIFTPLVASDQPFVFDTGDEKVGLLYPWFRALPNVTQPSDYFFNMALIGFVPWVVGSLAANVWMKRQGWHGRRRLGYSLLAYIVLICALATLFMFNDVRPGNRYSSRSFVTEQLRDANKSGVYAPIPFGPNEQDLDSIFKPPNYRKDESLWKKANDGFPHFLGTDNSGRDVLVRMLYGTRISLTVGFVAVSIYMTIGIVLGALAGYFGGRLDMLISRVIEVVLLFPSFFLILTLVGLMGSGIYVIMIVIGLTGWPTIARLIRGEVLKQRSIDYTVAARSLGASHGRIIFRHILPNALSPALVAIPFGIAGAIITEAGLSLLGFGVQAPTPTWGVLLQLASKNYNYWWLVVFPAIAIFFTVTVFNLVGNGLRDAMDPRLRR